MVVRIQSFLLFQYVIAIKYGLKQNTSKHMLSFGLCAFYLRNVKGFGWNHKRVYRIYRELELNLRIKPRKRLKRGKPEPLAVPERPNDTWSMGNPPIFNRSLQ